MSPANRPAALAEVPQGRQVHLDVRDDIARGEEPLVRIMRAVKALGADEVLVLRAPFEPVPLYEVLGRRGLTHWTEHEATNDWQVWFYRDKVPPAGPAPVRPGAAPRGRTVIDVRGLEPPQPMVRVLQAVGLLAPGAELEVLHERRPTFLYPQLEDRGFVHETDEPEPGLVRIRIRRAAARP